MKNKRFIMYCAILIIVFILIFIGYFIYKNIKKENKNSEFEYVPQEEISEEQLRQTVVTLYFLDSNEYKLAPEARTIDSKQLVSNPYEVLINLLISGPKNEKLLKLIPDGTSLIKAELKDDILFLDFSSEFVKEQNLGKEQEELIIKYLFGIDGSSYKEKELAEAFECTRENIAIIKRNSLRKLRDMLLDYNYDYHL